MTLELLHSAWLSRTNGATRNRWFGLNRVFQPSSTGIWHITRGRWSPSLIRVMGSRVVLLGHFTDAAVAEGPSEVHNCGQRFPNQVDSVSQPAFYAVSYAHVATFNILFCDTVTFVQMHPPEAVW